MEVMPRKAALFRIGRSQAVRLPREFHFERNNVFIRRDPKTGDVILSRWPGSWAEFFALAEKVGPPDDFMAERVDPPAQKQNPL
jgi:antitoxin VapB